MNCSLTSCWDICQEVRLSFVYLLLRFKNIPNCAWKINVFILPNFGDVGKEKKNLANGQKVVFIASEALCSDGAYFLFTLINLIDIL